MKTRTKIIISVALALIILLGLWISYRSPDSSTVAKVGIGTFSQAIDYGPVYVARHFGWFEQALGEAGAGSAEYMELGGFDEIQTALSQGRLHALFSAEAPVIKLVSDGAQIRIVENGCKLQQEVLVRKDRAINSIADLRNKSIAVAEGTSSHYGLLNILASAGLSISDIKLRPGFPGEIKPLYEAGGVDAWAVWPPFVEEQVIAGKGVALTGGEAKIQSVMSLPRTLIDRNARTAKALLTAIRRAKEWMRSNPDEAITIVSQALRMDRAVIALSWPKHNWGARLDENVLTDIDAKAIFLKGIGVVTEAAPVPTRKDLVDLELGRQ